jgi:hypothetical protein
MRYALILTLAMMFCGCVASNGIVRSQAVSFDDIIEDTTDKLLVLNILRAKDKAPLHFNEIPSIHESIQATASLTATYPFGMPLFATANPGRSSVTPGLNLQVSPSFEIDHLDTKDFVTGMATPIDTKFVKYWLDRGLDPRIVLLLFFSAADITETTVGSDGAKISNTIRIRNSPRDAIDSLKEQEDLSAKASDDETRCESLSDFQHYLKFINSLKTFTARYVSSNRVLAEHINPHDDLKALESIAALDSTKYQWIRHSPTDFEIDAVSSEARTALCYLGTEISSGAESPSPQASCGQSVVGNSADNSTASSDMSPIPWTSDRGQRGSYCAQFNRVLAAIDATDSKSPSTPKPQLRLETRSVGEIIQFLGDLLEFQEELRKYDKSHSSTKLKLNNPVTFGYCADELGGPSPGCADQFFNLRHDSCNARFSLTYRGETYSVANYNRPNSAFGGDDSCSSDQGRAGGSPVPKDHTLEVLAVVHQLIDLQKSAQDIRETPYVQVLP